MRIIWLQLLMLLAFIGAAWIVPYLTLQQFVPFFGFPMSVCILFDWVLAFEMKGVRRARDWKERLTLGWLVPVQRNWIKPVPFGLPVQLTLISVAMMAGAIARLLWITHS